MDIHLEAVAHSYLFFGRIHFLNHRPTNLLPYIHYPNGRDLAITPDHAHRHSYFYAVFLADVTDDKRPFVLHADHAAIE